jgi:hypothetical protein
VPVSSSGFITASGDGTGDIDVAQSGRIDGADMFPTHSRDVIGALTSISCINRPRMLKMEALPASVPIAMSVSGASQASFNALSSSTTVLFLLSFEILGPTATTARHVAGPETCYVRSTWPPLPKSTSRHRPSCLMLTTRNLEPGIKSAAVTPPMAGLCSLLITPILTGCK